MYEMNVNARGVGVQIKEEKAQIRVWSPESEAMAIHVMNKNLHLPLQKEEIGYWYLETGEINTGDRYKFVINNKDEWPDPASLSQPDSVHGPSEVIDVNYDWTDQSWQNTALNKYIIYELHTGTFSSAGTFAGIKEKLDHLIDLGITAIEIMPVAQFPGDRNWGYDGVFPFAIQNSYGGAKALQHLVNLCHQKGLAIILDVVYNHLGPEGNYLGLFGPYFTDKYNTPWGNAINFDDAWCDGVRNYFIENALMWLRDFHIDALRLDAVHAIKDLSAVHFLRELKMRVNELQEQTGRTYYLIVESDLNDTRFIDPLLKKGFGMEAQWIDEFHHALRVAGGQSPTGYYSDFNGVDHLAKSFRDAYVYDGQYSPHRKKHFGIKAEDNPGEQFIVFSQNHDQVGNRMLGERTSTLVSFEMQKLMAGAVLCSPFLPMLFMGEEWSETNPFLYFVSHTDQALAEAVRNGRKAEFAAFHAEGEAPDPVSEETFQHSKLQWHLVQTDQHKTMLSYYKALIHLRKTLPPLAQLNRKNLKAEADNQTIILQRWTSEMQVVCFMNFREEEVKMNIPLSKRTWECVFNSADKSWGGPAVETNIKDGTVSVLPASLVILKSTE